MKPLLLILVCFELSAQTAVDLRSQSKDVDFSTAPATTPWKTGTSLPAACGVGQAFFNTGAPAGANVYVCTAPNQWTLATGGGGGGGGGQGVTFTTGSGAPSSNCTTGQNLYVDTTNQDTWFCDNTNTWRKALTTTNSGAFVMTGLNGAAPGAGPSGNTSLFFSSAAKLGQTVDDAGSLATMVRPADCSVASQLVQKINTDGSVTCAAGGGGGGGGGGGQSVTFSTGSGAPSSNCTTGQNLYVDTTNQDTWFCDNTNTWRKALTTANSGAFVMTGLNGAAPGAGPSGNTSLFFSSAAKLGQTVDDAGSLATMVRPADCSVASQLVQKINTDGSVTCAAGGGGGGGSGTVSSIPHSFTPVSGSSGAPHDLWYNSGIGTACDNGNTGVHCFFHWFEDGATHSAAVIEDAVPAGWSSGSVNLTLFYQGNGSSVQWSVASACEGNGVNDPPTFNAAQNFSSTATASGKLYATVLSGVTMTGCAAGNAIYFRIQRADSTGYVNLTGASAGYTIP